MVRVIAMRWIIIGVLTLAAIGAALAVFSYRKASQPQDHLCWDPPPSTGTPPVKYVVTFDGGTPVETTIECVRVPLGLHDGAHIAVIKAVDALGQMSPPTTFKFVEP